MFKDVKEKINEWKYGKSEQINGTMKNMGILELKILIWDEKFTGWI